MVKNKFVIKITPIANDDSSEIYRYISDELYAEDAAGNLLNCIEG